MTEVYFDNEYLLEGMEILYKAVSLTMGANSRTATISTYSRPVVTQDGVTVARAIDLDYKRSAGAELIKEIAGRMEAGAGDGTTTVTVLTYHLLKEANKLLAAGHSPAKIKSELQAASKEVLKQLKGKKLLKADAKKIATVSSGNEEIGEIVAKALNTSDLVNVELGNGPNTELEIITGYTLPKGPVSMTQMKNATDVEVLVINEKIDDLGKLADVFNASKETLLILCKDITSDALNKILQYDAQGMLDSLVVKSPTYATKQKEVMDDVAAFTGTETYTFETLKDFKLGKCRKVDAFHDNVKLIDGAGKVSKRVKELKKQITSEESGNELNKRIAALKGKAVRIKVGGGSETEIEKLKHDIDDAVAAVLSAKEEGYVSGGGIAFVDLAKNMDTDTNGAKILQKALLQPFYTILRNAGDSGYKYINAVGDGRGVNVLNPDNIVDLYEEGIIDPAKVTRLAIEYSVSIAASQITNGVHIVTVPEENKYGAE